MDRKTIKKIIRKTLKPFAEEHGFQFHNPLILLREKESTIHIINFDVFVRGFNCLVAIQPLYFPEDAVHLSFGNSLNYLKSKVAGVWGSGDSEAELLKDLDEVMRLLKNDALPWFEDYGTPRGIITFIERELGRSTYLVLGFSEYLKCIFLGFSYLYLKKYHKAKPALRKAYLLLEEDKEDWAMEEKKLLSEMIKLVDKNANDEIDSQISKFIEYTKKAIKI